MMAFTRSRLMEKLPRVSQITNAYAGRDAAYADRVVEWLADVEKTLAELHNPLASLVAMQRADILSVDDGKHPAEISNRVVNRRKLKRVAASMAMSRTETALRETITDIDQKFDAVAEKLAQLLAVASSVHPIPFPPREPLNAWLDEVWKGLSVVTETQGLYTYIAARLTPSDRRYLLQEVLDNLWKNAPTSSLEPGHSKD